MKTKALRAAAPALLVPLLASGFVAIGAGAASASANECSTHQVTTEESNLVCLDVTGKGLSVSSIYGRFIGIWGRPKLTLYINGKLAYSKKAAKTADDYDVYFPSKFDKKYSNGTTMKVCLSEVTGDIPAKSLCTKAIKIHS
ncbi:hypothetical protein GTY41_25790 [Streptomyces sp. SID685]|uniref:hypothetical protein n=1 Tax=Streptomyces TaxID=1883 RepID=UPI0013699953|nr:hypothetical protein [Streptomyces sp. SID685]MYR88244.1 hypothetical protein [Streptomyces sp. SID685]